MNSPARKIKLITHEPGELVEVEARVAVVRPTRDQIAGVVAWKQAPMWAGNRDAGGRDVDYATADELLARFDMRVAVSDSQETPTKGREE